MAGAFEPGSDIRDDVSVAEDDEKKAKQIATEQDDSSLLPPQVDWISRRTRRARPPSAHLHLGAPPTLMQRNWPLVLSLTALSTAASGVIHLNAVNQRPWAHSDLAIPGTYFHWTPSDDTQQG